MFGVKGVSCFYNVLRIKVETRERGNLYLIKCTVLDRPRKVVVPSVFTIPSRYFRWVVTGQFWSSGWIRTNDQRCVVRPLESRYIAWRSRIDNIDPLLTSWGLRETRGRGHGLPPRRDQHITPRSQSQDLLFLMNAYVLSDITRRREVSHKRIDNTTY